MDAEGDREDRRDNQAGRRKRTPLELAKSHCCHGANQIEPRRAIVNEGTGGLQLSKVETRMNRTACRAVKASSHSADKYECTPIFDAVPSNEPALVCSPAFRRPRRTGPAKAGTTCWAWFMGPVHGSEIKGASPEPDGRASLSPASRVGRVPSTSSGSRGRTRPTGFMGRVRVRKAQDPSHELGRDGWASQAPP